jgi:hypothetical protein
MSRWHDQVRSLSALALAASTPRLCSLIALQNLGELSTDRGGAAEARSCLSYGVWNERLNMETQPSEKKAAASSGPSLGGIYPLEGTMPLRVWRLAPLT